MIHFNKEKLPHFLPKNANNNNNKNINMHNKNKNKRVSYIGAYHNKSNVMDIEDFG